MPGAVWCEQQKGAVKMSLHFGDIAKSLCAKGFNQLLALILDNIFECVYGEG